jgi:hypothetical protein
MPSDGGSPFVDACQDSIVIGVNGTSQPSSGTQAPRSLQTVCGTLSVTGTGPYQISTTLKGILPVRGNFPGVVMQNQLCPANQVIVGVDSRLGMWVDELRFLCAPITVSVEREMYTLSIGSATPLGTIGGDGGMPGPSVNCASGEIVTTLYIHAGDAIDAFGIGCAEPSLEFEN